MAASLAAPDPDEPDSSIRLLPRGCDGEAPLGRLPHAVQRLGHARPALGPVRALLVRVPLGPRPWLHRLRRRGPGFVRRLHSYYGGVRLLLIVHRRLRLLTFPPRTIWPRGPMADQEISRFPYKERARMPGSTTTPGRPDARAPLHRQRRHPGFVFYRGSMAGLPVPLPTLRRRPHGRLRTAWGRCGLLLLHRRGLAPPTPCRSPGAPV